MYTFEDDMIIRKYKPSDYLEVKELFVSGMKISNAPDSYIEKSLSKDLSCIQDTYFAGRGSFFIMERLSDGKMIGIVGLQDLSVRPLCGGTKTTTEDENGLKFYQLRRMSIHTSEHRKGRGKELINFCIRYARDNGFDGIKVSTGSRMTHAISFYLSLGFKDEGRFEVDVKGRKIIIAKFKFSLR